MIYNINGIEYNVITVKKNNKNTYIRISDNLEILVTTNYFTTKRYIKKLLDKNKDSLVKMLSKRQRQIDKKNSFFYLGKSYDIIEVSIIDDITIENNIIYVPSKKKFDKWYKNELQRIFSERLDEMFKLFCEVKVCPTLKIRNMKTRWGVYNRLKHTITLNSRLLEFDFEEIDYVIIHELSHVIHFNHSKDFWQLVSKYCPNYKIIQKRLKE